MRVLVAGTLGPLAALLVERLLSSGDAVAAAGTVAATTWPADVRTIAVDADAAAALRGFAPEALVLIGDAEDSRRRWARLTATLEASATAVDRFVHWGGRSSYGPGASGPWQEAAVDAAPGAAAAVAGALRRGNGAGLRGTWFRSAEVIGRRVPGAVPGLAAMPFIPRLRDDPLLQWLHEDDAVELMMRAVHGGEPGTYNAAADGVVRIREVGRALRRATVRLPLPLALGAVGATWATGRGLSPGRWLRWARGAPVLDNGRLKTHFGYRPRHDARAALAAARSALDA